MHVGKHGMGMHKFRHNQRIELQRQSIKDRKRIRDPKSTVRELMDH